jgi:protease I
MRETAVPGTDNRRAVPLEGEPRGRVAILTHDEVEDVEFFYPYYRFVEAGFAVDVITPQGGTLTGYRGTTLQETMPLAAARPEDYVALYVPGGLAPSHLVDDAGAIAFVRAFGEQRKLIGSVCHGPLVLARSGLAEGHDLTGFHHIEDDVVASGARYLDQPVVEDGLLITARKPGDLPRELARIIARLTA